MPRLRSKQPRKSARTARTVACSALAFVLFSCGQPSSPPDGGEGNTRIFQEITQAVRLDFVHVTGMDSSYFMPESIGSGAALFDFDNDGDLDIYLINGAPHGRNSAIEGRVPNRLYRQEADGTFVEVTAASGLGDSGYGMGAAVGDIDNDGDPDLYVTNYGADRLYLNNGDGTFADITRQARIRNLRWGCSAVFFDYNLDGYLDLFVTNYVDYNPASHCMDGAGRQDYCGPKSFPGARDVLFRNNGNGTFTNVTAQAGIGATAYRGLGVISADFNSDGFPDLYVANDAHPNNLWLNRQDGTFQDMAMREGAALNAIGQAEAGMGIALGDVEGDGDFDLFISHVRSETNTFYRRNDFGFMDESTRSGLAGRSIPFTGFGTGFLDFDNDGDLDLAIANGRVVRGPLLVDPQKIRKSRDYWDDYAEPNLLFANDGTGRFHAVGADDAFCRAVQNSRGLAFGDFDSDGGIDLLVCNDGGRTRLYRNVALRGHWLGVRAIDPALHRDAIGAKITVVAGGRKILRAVQPGYSFLSSNDVRVHFGLGTAAAAEWIEIEWPGGEKERFAGRPADRYVTLEKGRGQGVQ